MDRQFRRLLRLIANFVTVKKITDNLLSIEMDRRKSMTSNLYS